MIPKSHGNIYEVHHANLQGAKRFYKSRFNQLTEENFAQIRERGTEALRG